MKTTFGPIPKYTRVRLINKKEHPFISIGGPCAIESLEQIKNIYKSISVNVTHFRGGVFRAGTYPSDNFGLQIELLQEMHKEAIHYQKFNVIDVLDIRDLEKLDPYTDVFQVGMRQAQNYSLLTELGRQKKQVILKRGSWMTASEFLGAAEYILKGGNENLVLCERGGVSHLNHCRWELSISIIAKLKQITGLPVIIDASHGTGQRELVTPLTLAGISAGANGFIAECHQEPDKSLSDSEQTISIEDFNSLAQKAIKLSLYLKQNEIVS